MVALIALTVSFPIAIATVIIATLLGAALLGIVGALVAIPVAAGTKFQLDEITIPRLDRS
jgi:predicted PurR-regulated permease PerM